MNKDIITETELQKKILTIRGIQVMLDSDLAELYNVETKVFNQAVKRNIARFPEKYRFQLTSEEFDHLRSQIVISSDNSLRSQIVTLKKGASLKDLGKKWFAFSKMNKNSLEFLDKLT